MTAEPASLTRLARLQREFDLDVAALDSRAQETAEILDGWGDQGLARPELVLIAVNIHGYYTALEAACERVAKQLDQELPQGNSWHLELLEQMRTNVPGLRPALIPDEVARDLHELRKFRHFFRNAYVLELDAEQVRQQAQRLTHVHDALRDHLGAFQQYLTALIKAL